MVELANNQLAVVVEVRNHIFFVSFSLARTPLPHQLLAPWRMRNLPHNWRSFIFVVHSLERHHASHGHSLQSTLTQ